MRRQNRNEEFIPDSLNSFKFFSEKAKRVYLAWFLLFLFFSGLSPFAVPAEGPSKVQSPSISSQEFLSSPFAKFFKQHQYQKALDVLTELAGKYPEDPIILRYEALTLERLGRTQEAILIYQRILAKHPHQASARFFLGRAYVSKGQYQAAAGEFRRVMDSKAKEYSGWAHAELNRLHRGILKKKPKTKQKRFYLVGKSGIVYDSNPLLMPNDSNLRSGKIKKGTDFLMDVTAGVVPVRRPDLRFDMLYIGQEILHDSRTSRVNFHSHGFALVAKERHLFGRQAFLFGERYDFRSNFLKSDLFSISNRFLLSADTSFIKRTRTHVYSRFNILNFARNGSIPDQTSRDGLRTGIGVTQYFYSPSRKRFFFIKEEFNLNETRGDNFDRRGLLSRAGIHTPVDFFKKTDLDVSGGFNFGAYHDFSSLSTLDLEQRRDKGWDIYSGLTYHWRPWFAIRAFYRFIKSVNRNNFFDRDRHMAGGEIVFSV